MSDSRLSLRANHLRSIADLRLATETAPFSPLEQALIESNLAIHQLILQIEALLEKHVVSLRERVTAVQARADQDEEIDPAELSRLGQEAEKFVRMCADNEALIAGLKWPARLVNLVPQVAAAGGVSGEVAPLVPSE